MSRFLPGACLLCVAMAVVSARTPQEQGRAVLERAIAALGGREALGRLDNWIVSGQGRENLTAEWQGRAFDMPTWRDHQEIVVVAAGAVAWERRTPRNDLSLRWRRFIHRADAAGFVDLNAGTSRLTPPGTPAADRQALARRIPHVLVDELSRSTGPVRWLNEARIEGVMHDVIDAALTDGTSVRVYVARQAGTIGRLEYQLSLAGPGASTVSWNWLGWAADPAIGQRPARQVIAVNSTPYQEVTFTRYAASAPDAASFMETPAGLRPSSVPTTTGPASAGPATGEVAPGIHVRNVSGFNVMAIKGRNGLVLVEAPDVARGLESIPASGGARAGRVPADQLTWLQSTFPDTPIRHIVISHHHSDHIGGIPTLASPGAIVITSRADAGAARQALGPAASVRVESVAGRRVIHDGVRRIEILSVGENPHTVDNLVVWLPTERILFQGDLFYFDDGGAFPPPGRETMNRFFAGWLAARGIEPRAIYGVHNIGAAGPDAVARMR